MFLYTSKRPLKECNSNINAFLNIYLAQEIQEDPRTEIPFQADPQKDRRFKKFKEECKV